MRAPRAKPAPREVALEELCAGAARGLVRGQEELDARAGSAERMAEDLGTGSSHFQWTRCLLRFSVSAQADPKDGFARKSRLRLSPREAAHYGTSSVSIGVRFVPAEGGAGSPDPGHDQGEG